MWTLARVERELKYHRAIIAADNLVDFLDNDGNVAYTVKQALRP